MPRVFLLGGYSRADRLNRGDCGRFDVFIQVFRLSHRVDFKIALSLDVKRLLQQTMSNRLSLKFFRPMAEPTSCVSELPSR